MKLVRPIDADAAKNEYFALMKELLKATTSNLSDDAISLLAGYSIMDNAPTIDAVTVVRCKDCKYHTCCEIEGCIDPDNNGFCSDGEARPTDE